MGDYEKFEADCKNIRKVNKNLLNEFRIQLKSSGLSDKIIQKHISNIDFYINNFLLYEDAVEAKDGANMVSMFLGYWFIKKAMWASQAHIKNNAASLKKFYAFMLEKKLICAEDLSDLEQTIKDEMPEWLATVERYDDSSIEDMEDVWNM